VISGFAFLLLLFFLKQSGLTAKGIRDLAIDAKAAAEKARGTPSFPAKEKRAADLAKAANKAASASKAPPEWPQKLPPGLPPFPAGWEPDEPPPQSVQTRATQLLPVLWKQGPGASRKEKTAGRWITYQAQSMGTKKGVVAFRIKPQFLPTA
jgi:hypothetical protein